VRLLLAHQASGNDDDFDVLANGEVVGRIFKVNAAPVGSPWIVDLGLRVSPGSRANPRLRCDARGRHGWIRKELAARVIFQATDARRCRPDHHACPN
jgi:hypothetical protein